MYVTLKADGTYEEHEGAPSLEEMQQYVKGPNQDHGWVEVVSIKHGIDMWINEEGKYENPTRNLLAGLLTEDIIGPGDWIAGDVVFTGNDEETGETIGLTDDQLEYLRQLQPRAGSASRVIPALNMVDVTGITV